MKKTKTNYLFCLIAVFISLPGIAQIPDPIREEIQRRVQMELNPSIALGVYDKAGDHYFISGYQNTTNKQKATPKTLYRLGSLGNTLTGLLTGVLLSAEKLEITTPAGSLVYPPLELRDKQGKDIYAMEIASYQSGISDKAGLTVSPKVSWDSLYIEENLRRIRPYRSGGAFIYSDWAMALLAEGLAESSKTSFPELVNKEIITPLKLKLYPVVAGSNNSNMAMPEKRPEANTTAPHLEASTLHWAASIEGLLGYGKVMLDPPPSFKKAIDTTKHTYLETENGIQTGLGWLKDLNGNLYHSGHYRGYNTFIAIDMQQDRVIALATNTSEADITDLGLYLLDPENNPLYPFIEKPIEKGALEDYSGQYLNDALGLELQLEVHDEELKSIRQEDTLSLHFMGEHRFYFQGQKAHLSFETDENGNVVGALLNKNGRKVMFIKMK